MDLGAYGHICQLYMLYTVGLRLGSCTWYGTKRSQSVYIYIFAQTLLVTQKIDATNPPGYGQPSDPLSYIPRLEAATLFHTDYMTLVASYEISSCPFWIPELQNVGKVQVHFAILASAPQEDMLAASDLSQPPSLHREKPLDRETWGSLLLSTWHWWQ